jgi:hypothetical protein
VLLLLHRPVTDPFANELASNTLPRNTMRHEYGSGIHEHAAPLLLGSTLIQISLVNGSTTAQCTGRSPPLRPHSSVDCTALLADLGSEQSMELAFIFWLLDTQFDQRGPLDTHTRIGSAHKPLLPERGCWRPVSTAARWVYRRRTLGDASNQRKDSTGSIGIAIDDIRFVAGDKETRIEGLGDLGRCRH